MGKVLIIANSHKEKSYVISNEVEDFLKTYKLECTKLYTEAESFDATLEDDTILIISIGGDGTMLSVVHKFYQYQIPIFAINAGDLGFITPFSPDTWKDGLKTFLDNKAVIKNKMLLNISIYEDDNKIGNTIAFNEVTISKYDTQHLLKFDAYIGSECFASSLATDGVIVATPTGSTAYSMSAGGSVILGDIDSFIFTPSSPFMAIDRGIVFSAKSCMKLSISNNQKSERAIVVSDGVPFFILTKKHTVFITKSEVSCPVIANPLLSDIARIGEKMMWKPGEN